MKSDPFGRSLIKVRLALESAKAIAAALENPEYPAEARRFCLDYFDRCREGAKSGTLPEWDEEAERKLADGFCYAAALGRRWLLSWDDRGRQQLSLIPSGCYVIAPEDFPKVLREPDAFPTRLLPEVMNACMERLAAVAR